MCKMVLFWSCNSAHISTSLSLSPLIFWHRFNKIYYTNLLKFAKDVYHLSCSFQLLSAGVRLFGSIAWISLRIHLWMVTSCEINYQLFLALQFLQSWFFSYSYAYFILLVLMNEYHLVQVISEFCFWAFIESLGCFTRSKGLKNIVVSISYRNFYFPWWFCFPTTFNCNYILVVVITIKLNSVKYFILGNTF